ncbi:MAG: DUF935 family protein [Candidatus Thiodiazotropha lotti]|uniref:DUF935 family protein n=1 Tax=Candidatus Thiodiazotropha lotti TaxID=2792787 RepID=A0A9E4N0S2_9GAMM|nr:DUF935 family protein [Candidatus Thiodiazotropha lotti]MCW4203971.1 DUF935 family protein [Candidatus Thiodiazotropha lotti]
MSTNITTPPKIEIAKTQAGIDITVGYADKLMQPEDAVLLTRGGGDLKIYQELLRDEQVLSCWQQRQSALTSKETFVEPGGTSAIDKKAADAMKEMLQSLEWDDITKKMMYGLLYGYSVSELMWASDGSMLMIDDIKIRKQRRFRFGPGGELYLITQDQPTGKLMQCTLSGPVTRNKSNPHGPKFWVYSTGADNSDDPYGLGLGHQLYWPVFFKRSNIKFWLIFLEKFGTPTAMAKLPQAMMDSRTLQGRALEALRSIQSSSAVVFPEGAEVELIEAARSGTADYSTLHERMDKAIAKIILSQTMTTDDGSSRAQSQVHQQVRDDVVKADSDLICGSFNTRVIPWWTSLNFENAKPPKVWRKTEEAEDLHARAKRDTKIFDMGLRPTKEYLISTYGPQYSKWVRTDVADSATSFAEGDASLSFSFNMKPETALLYFQNKGLDLTFSWKDMLAESHSYAFTVAKMMEVDLLHEVRKQVDQAIASGSTLQQFIKELKPRLRQAGWWGKKAMIDPITGKSVTAQLGSARRLETIFRANLQAAYAAGHWANAQATKASIPYLMYDAVDDDRTRPEHKSWDGLVLPVDDPFWNTHYPPNGWGCRCGTIQMSQSDLDQEGLSVSKSPWTRTKRWKNPRTGERRKVPVGIDPSWDYNPGKAGMQRLLQVFREKIDNLPDGMRLRMLAWARNNSIAI